MAAPVINTTTSVLGFLQWEPWAYQPWASNDPTFWNSTALPAGVVFDTGIGTLTGPAEVPGVYLFSLTAGNVDGVSEPVLFALGIEASTFRAPANAVELLVDVTTKKVTVAGAPNGEDPILFCKAGDDLILNIRFMQNGIAFEMDLTEVKVSMKELEPEQVLATSSGWLQVGTGASATYGVHIKVEGDALRASLSQYEGDEATEFAALTEIQWTQDNSTGDFGPASLVASSRNFKTLIPRDIITNA